MKNIIWRICYFTACISSAISIQNAAFGLELSVDPNGLEIQYRIPGTSLYNVIGTRTVDLPPDDYELVIGKTSIPFELLPDGSVTGNPNASVDFISNTIEFHPGIQVNFDPGIPDIRYRVSGSPIYNVLGFQSALFVPETTMELRIGESYIQFHINADGTVSGDSNDSIEFVGDTIQFRDALPVHFDPGFPDIQYRVSGNLSIYNVRGNQTGYFIPDTTMVLSIGSTQIPFHINADGTVSGDLNDSIEFVGDTIQFREALPVHFDPGFPDIQYRVSGNLSIYNVWGNQTGYFIPGTTMVLSIGSTQIPFHINADGTVGGDLNDSVEFVGDTIQFREALPVHFDPRIPDIQFRVGGTTVYNVWGYQTGYFIPGTTMTLNIGVTTIPFHVNADGTVTGNLNDSVEFIEDTVLFRPAIEIDIVPYDPNVQYRIGGTRVYNVRGNQTGLFIPATTMRLSVGSLSSLFSINTDCTVTPSILDVGGDLFEFYCHNGDSDDDGLSDDEESIYGTDPFNPDSDNDGLLDGTEVDMAEGGSCPNPLQADSDGDTLGDGYEVELGTNLCLQDTDVDGVPDALDPFPTNPEGNLGFIEGELRNLSDLVSGLNLALFSSKNANASKGRRNAMSNKLNGAANAISEGNLPEAIDQLNSFYAKIDDHPSPKDWMVASDAKSEMSAAIQQLLVILALL